MIHRGSIRRCYVCRLDYSRIPLLLSLKVTFQAGYQASRKAGTGCRSVGPIADLFLIKHQLIRGLYTDAINSSNAPAYRSYGLIFIRHALQNMGVAMLTHTPRLTSLSLNSKKVLSLNMSNNEALLHIELNRILNIAQAFTDATRALIADMCAKGFNPYDKRPIGPSKRPMKTAWLASSAVVHFTLHHTLSLRRSVPPSAATSVCVIGI